MNIAIKHVGVHIPGIIAALIICSPATVRCQNFDEIPLSALERWEHYDISTSRANGNLRTQIRNAYHFMDTAFTACSKGDIDRALQKLYSASGVMSPYVHDLAAYPILATIRTNQALCYYEGHAFNAARDSLYQALLMRNDIRKRKYDTALARTLENWGALCNNRDDSAGARLGLHGAMVIYRQISGGRPDPQLARSIYNTGIFHNRVGEYDAADSLFDEAITMVRSLDSIDGGTRLPALLERTAIRYQRRRAFPKAESLAMQLLVMRQRASKKGRHPDVVGGLSLLAAIRDSMGNVSGADSCYLAALGLARRLPGRKDSLLGNRLAALGSFRARQGTLAEAGKFFSEGIGLYRRAFGKRSHLELARALAGLGAVQEQRGEYSASSGSFGAALLIYRELQGKLDGYEHAAVYAGLGRALHGLEEYAEAARHYRAALDMYRYEKRLGNAPHRLVADILAGLGAIYLDRGNYPIAERYFDESLEMYKRLHPDSGDAGYAVALRCAARYYHQRGDLQKGETMLREALAAFGLIDNRAYDRHEAAALRDLSAIRAEQGDITGAIAQLEGARGIFERMYGAADHFDLASAINGVGGLYLHQGNDLKAASGIERAVAMYGRLCKGKDHPDYAAALGNMGLYLAHSGKTAKATPFFRRSSAMYKKLHEKTGHLELVFGLYAVARSAESVRMNDQAYACYKNLIWMLPRTMREASLFEGEEQQIRFQARLGQMSSSLLRFFLDAGETGELFNAALWAKGRVLSAIEWRNGVIAELRNNNRDIDSLWVRFQAGRRALSDTYIPAGDAAIAEWRKGRDSLLAMVEQTEGELAEKIAAIRKKKGREDSWSATARNLKPEECAIEFIRIPFPAKEGKPDSARYCALVLRHSKGWGVRPELVPLCGESELWNILQHQVGPREDKSYVNDAGRAQDLYELVWNPIASKLNGIKRVYLSTDGLLNRVSFAALEDALNNEELLGRYDLRHLFSTRDLLASRRGAPPMQPSQRKTAAVFGAVRFNADSAELAGQLALLAEEDRTDGHLYDVRFDDAKELPRGTGGVPRDPARGSGLQPLPGSKPEADSVAAILERHGYTTRSYMGARATEDAFIGLHAPSVVHVATHAVVFPEPKGSAQEVAALQAGGGIRVVQYATSPLLRSMILLAGANRVWTLNPPLRDIGDGVVTAYDVAHMPLRGTELVVLSACETGLGEILPGEGVFGLKRAFRAAGAASVIISLWKVPDDQTRMLMELFYRNWLEKKMEKSEALAQAQQTMKKDSSPYYWGAFVLVGE